MAPNMFGELGISEIVKNSKTADDLYYTLLGSGIDPSKAVDAIKYEAFMQRLPGVENAKAFGIIPTMRLRSPQPVNSGMLSRAADELSAILTKKTNRNKILKATGLGATLALSAYLLTRDNAPTPYIKETDALMKGGLNG